MNRQSNDQRSTESGKPDGLTSDDRRNESPLPEGQQPYRSGLAARGVTETGSAAEHRSSNKKLPRRTDRPRHTDRAADASDDPEQRYRDDELR